MIFVDLALRTAALASAIIATLRAGSRVAYLLEHDVIGIMEGPVVRNTNETNPLFELSEAFRHCVRLTIVPDQYENVETRRPATTAVEQYPLSPRPYFAEEETTTEASNEMNTSATNDQVIPQIESKSKPNVSFWKRQYNAVATAFTTVPSTISHTGKYLAVTPQVVSYWSSRVWNWKREKSDESDIEDEGKTTMSDRCRGTC